MNTHRIGIDIGVYDSEDCCSQPRRRCHIQPIRATSGSRVSVDIYLSRRGIRPYGDNPCTISITGSVGMGVAERCGLPFVQEVVAAAKFVTELYPSIHSIIDIGGEECQVVFLHKDRPVDLRMNGNCAGGTGRIHRSDGCVTRYFRR